MITLLPVPAQISSIQQNICGIPSAEYVYIYIHACTGVGFATHIFKLFDECFYLKLNTMLKTVIMGELNLSSLSQGA